MSQDNPNTGAKRAGTRIKMYVFAVVGAMALAIGLAAPAFASTIPANFPGDNGISCNAWHGAPGGFGPNSPFYTISGPQGGLGGYTFGQAQQGHTGPNNAGYSVYCNG